MSERPWMKFYPSDWRADPALRTCSIGARGLWMEMLCVMHEADPRGSLRVNGGALQAKQIAALAGIKVRECEKYLEELEVSGVFSRENDGEIFSRRMKRETAKALKDKENGKAGGNPALKQGVNPQDKAQKLEARDQSQIEENRSLRSLDDWPSDFRERFWQRYPRKAGRQAAIRKLETIRKSGAVTFAVLFAGVERYELAARSIEPQFVKHPATWLNAGCWDDDPAALARSTGPPGRAPSKSFMEMADELRGTDENAGVGFEAREPRGVDELDFGGRVR